MTTLPKPLEDGTIITHQSLLKKGSASSDDFQDIRYEDLVNIVRDTDWKALSFPYSSYELLLDVNNHPNNVCLILQLLPLARKDTDCLRRPKPGTNTQSQANSSVLYIQSHPIINLGFYLGSGET